ncbi:MAG: DUF167 domain-containing protein [Kiritimatiellae bacterium]|nr:DUF167 domain-containing protein [Kiritimatiellia bacterium]
MSWIEEKERGTVIQVRVVPRSKAERVDGLLGDALKIRLQAPPVEGKANKALLKFLSKQTGLSGSRIELLSGETNRNKRVFFAGVSRGELERALLKE